MSERSQVVFINDSYELGGPVLALVPSQRPPLEDEDVDLPPGRFEVAGAIKVLPRGLDKSKCSEGGDLVCFGRHLHQHLPGR